MYIRQEKNKPKKAIVAISYVFVLKAYFIFFTLKNSVLACWFKLSYWLFAGVLLNKSVLWQVNSLGETAERLIQSHPEAVDDIQEKCTELNTAWSSLVGRADQRKDKLGNSHDLQRFLSDFRWGERTANLYCFLTGLLIPYEKVNFSSVALIAAWDVLSSKQLDTEWLWCQILVISPVCYFCRDLMSWINGIRGLVSSDELAKDVTGAEALLERHQVLSLVFVFSQEPQSL